MNAPPPLPSAPTGATANLGHALGGIARLSLRQVFTSNQAIITLVLAALFGVLTALVVNPGDFDRYAGWLVQPYLTILLPIFAFMSGANAMREDMKSGTVDYILTRPVPRLWFVLGRFAVHVAGMQVVYLAVFAVLAGVGVFRQVPDLGAILAPLLLAQIMAVVAFQALGFFCGSLTSRYLVVGIVYAGIVENGLGRIPLQINRLSILHHLRSLAPSLGEPAPDRLLALGFLVLITAVLVTASAALFTIKEFAGEQSRET